MSETKKPGLKKCLVCEKEFPANMQVCPEDGGLLIKAKTDRFIGTKINDRVKVLEVVGTGGMGVVYKGQHDLMERMVAVKMMHAGLAADKSCWKRFQREAKAASSLKHPNVVTVHDFGLTEDGDLYLVMEFLEGQSLSHMVKQRGPISESLCRELFTQVASALEHAHEKSILHRDLKPSNIILLPQKDNTYTVKVVDFGLAKIADGTDQGQTTTNTGESVGTPAYMSPEQCHGQTLDARADVYSLGVCMFECLTGRPPFVGANALQTVSLQITQPPPTLRQVNADVKVSTEMEAMIMRCLKKDPAQRFQSMAEVRSEIERMIEQSSAKRPVVDIDRPTVPQTKPAYEETEISIPSGASKHRVYTAPPVETAAKAAAPANKNTAILLAAGIGAAMLSGAAIWFMNSNKAATVQPVVHQALGDDVSSATDAKQFETEGVVYYFERTKAGGTVFLNPPTGELLRLNFKRFDAAGFDGPDGFSNGAVWKVKYHVDGGERVLDSARFDATFDKDVQAIDTFVRKHWALIGKQKWQEAYDDFAPNSRFRRQHTLEQFAKGFAGSHPNPKSETTPAAAVRIESMGKEKAKVGIDLQWFFEGEGKMAAILVRENGRWYFDQVRPYTDRW